MVYQNGRSFVVVVFSVLEIMVVCICFFKFVDELVFILFFDIMGFCKVYQEIYYWFKNVEFSSCIQWYYVIFMLVEEDEEWCFKIVKYLVGVLLCMFLECDLEIECIMQVLDCDCIVENLFWILVFLCNENDIFIFIMVLLIGINVECNFGCCNICFLFGKVRFKWIMDEF